MIGKPGDAGKLLRSPGHRLPTGAIGAVGWAKRWVLRSVRKRRSRSGVSGGRGRDGRFGKECQQRGAARNEIPINGLHVRFPVVGLACAAVALSERLLRIIHNQPKGVEERVLLGLHIHTGRSFVTSLLLPVRFVSSSLPRRRRTRGHSITFWPTQRDKNWRGCCDT